MKKLLLVLTLSVMSAHAADSAATYDAHRQKVDAAIAAGDYDAWKVEHDAYSNGKGGAKITRENFATFAKMHQAQAAGRTEEAAALKTELGIGQGAGKGKGQAMQGCQKVAGTQCAKGQGMGKGAGKGSGNGQKGQGCQRKQ